MFGITNPLTGIVLGLTIIVLMVVAMVLLGTIRQLADVVMRSAGEGNRQSEDGERNAFKNWQRFSYGPLAIISIGLAYFFIARHTQDPNIEAAPSLVSTSAATPKPPPTTTLAAVVATPEMITSGRSIFTQKCAACHGLQGQGVVGPNLTDEYWLHGGKRDDISSSVTNGYLDKGMPSWGTILSTKEITNVSMFIQSLQGTHPANPKKPEGVKVV